MAWHRLKDQLDWNDVGGRLLANIARGIYSHEAVLREYVQNACDAYNMLDIAPSDATIVITPEGPNLSIQDFGIGMDEEEIRTVKKIAVSTKADLEDMTGFRGIGIWAGFQACDRLEVLSTKQGVGQRFRLEIDFKGIRSHVDENMNIKALVDPRYHIDRDDASVNENYTRVTLYNVHPDYAGLLQPEEISRIVSHALPCRLDPNFEHALALQNHLNAIPYYQEFPIKVESKDGTKEIYKAFPSVPLDPPEVVILKANDVEVARTWFCRSQETALRVDGLATRGFRMRIRNFAVGPVNIYGDENGRHYGILRNLDLRTTNRLAWFCGEVHVTNPAILPNTPRDGLELDGLAKSFIEEVREFYKVRIGDAGAHSDFNGYKEAVKEAELLITKCNGTPPGPDSQDENDRQLLLQKLERAVNKTKGDKSGNPAAQMLKQLLNQPPVRKQRKQALGQLKGLAPKTGHSTVKSGPTPTDNKKSRNKTFAKPSERTGLNAEELMSDIIEVLERRLGSEHDELAAIAEEIRTILQGHGVVDADQPIP